MKTTLQEVAILVGGIVAEGEGSLPLTGFSSIAEAETGDITFLGNPRYAPALKKTRASAVLVDEQFQAIPPSLAVIRVPNPTLKFSLIVQRVRPLGTARYAGRSSHGRHQSLRAVRCREGVHRTLRRDRG